MSTGSDLIVEERSRQIIEEGFSHAHDDDHPAGTLEQAAYAYLYLTHAVTAPPDTQHVLWPFHPSWFKPSTSRTRNLVRAGALLCAEAERWDRAGDHGERDRLMRMAANVAAEIDQTGGRDG